MDVPVAEFERLTKDASNEISIISPVGSGLSNDTQPSYLNPYFYYNPEDWEYVYETTTQLTTFKQTFLSYEVANNFKILKTSFEKERYKSTISEEILNNLFQKLAIVISELSFEKGTVEITSSNSIKLSMAFSNNLLLIISKPFETLEDVSENDIIFSLFKNREMIASNVSKTTDFVEGFKRFLLL